MDSTFHERLRYASRRSDSCLCVGLDPRLDRLPEECRRAAQPLLHFCQGIVDATAPFACAFKPQFACYAATGATDELREAIRYIRERHPRIPVILDAKRSDIGDTAELYARELFEFYDVDAATVSPYLGWDTVEPYLAWPGRGVIVLCHTSNPGSPWLQEYPGETPVYLRVAEQAQAADAGNLMLVVGATFPEQLGLVRQRAPGLPFLVPGIGAQGGDLEAVFAHGLDADGGGLLLNASRSVIFASSGEDWREAAAAEAERLRDAMREARDQAVARP